MEDKTVKIHAYSGDAEKNAAPGTGQIACHLKTIVQLREGLKQAEMEKKASELEVRVKDMAAVAANELVGKNAELEEEKRKSVALAKTIEQLREGLRQEQAKTAGMVARLADLEAKEKEIAALEAKARELTEALGKIAAIAAAGKAG